MSKGNFPGGGEAYETAVEAHKSRVSQQKVQSRCPANCALSETSDHSYNLLIPRTFVQGLLRVRKCNFYLLEGIHPLF